MTKQALGEFVDWLEQAGFVVSGRDPADGFGFRLVTRTDAGNLAADTAQRANRGRWSRPGGSRSAPERYESDETGDARNRLSAGGH